MKYLLLSLRVNQWVKNFFVFLPLIFGIKLFVYPENIRTLIAFLVFSLAASCVYLVNDMIDAKKDREHPTKKLRPIASGKVSFPAALIAALALGSISLLSSYFIGLRFLLIVLVYLVFNLAYSVFLKEVVIIDVFCLGLFFLLRVAAGSIAAGVEMSPWIMIMTVLLALFLGFNKRRQEIRISKHSKTETRGVLLKYDEYYIDQLIGIVTSSIVIVYMLYTVDARTVFFFGTNSLIFSTPFVYYGIFRYLYLVHRLHRDGDPTRMLLTDRPLKVNIALWIAVCITVIYLKG